MTPDSDDTSQTQDPEVDSTLRVLLAHRNRSVLDRVERALKGSESPKFESTRCGTIDEMIDLVREGQFDAVVVSYQLDEPNAPNIYSKIQKFNPDLPVVLLDLPDDESTLSILRAGAQDFLHDHELTTGRLSQAIRCGIIRQGRRTRSSHQVDLLQNLLEKIPDHIYFKDLASRFVKVNHSMAEMFGLDDPADLVGHTDFDFFTGEHAQKAFEDERELIAGETPLISKIEKESFPDGRVSWALTNKMPLRSKEGRTIGTFGISHDITDIHEMEKALEEERNLLKKTSAELLAKNNQLESDMAMAREIQLALLPTHYPQFPPEAKKGESKLRFEHRYIPTQAVGGDFFTVFQLSETKAGVLVCDVMGHGPRAAMVTAIVRALREELKDTALYPELFLSGLNSGLQTILRRVEDPMLCTGVYLVVDSETGEVEFASAGHPGPVHLRRAKSKAVPIQEYDSRHGPVLGLYEDVDYPKGKFTLAHDDVLLIFTDGLFEVPCDDGDDYGYDRLVEHFQRGCELSTDRLLDVAISNVMSHATNGFEDDVCLVAIERPGS